MVVPLVSMGDAHRFCAMRKRVSIVRSQEKMDDKTFGTMMKKELDSFQQWVLQSITKGSSFVQRNLIF